MTDTSAKNDGRLPDLLEKKIWSNSLPYETLYFEIDKPSDIVFSGLGFIAVKNAPASISVTVVKGCGVIVRDPIIG